MNFILKINESESPKAAYVGWTPVKCTLTVEGYDGISSLIVDITTGQFDHPKMGKANGQLSLYTSNKTYSKPVEKIEHDFQGQPKLVFYVAGRYPHASVARKDTYIQITSQTGEVEPKKLEFMVRVRKNANKLTQTEIDLFLGTFVQLAAQNTAIGKYEGRYTVKPCSILDEIALMHSYDTQNEIHNRESFHPWHRAYLLHLEREMQEKCPEVTIPYWKFDEKAEKVFTEDFIGKTCKFKLIDENGDGFEDEFNERYFIDKVPKFNGNNPMDIYKDHTLWGPLTRSYHNVDPAVGKSNPNIAEEDVVINYSAEFKEWCEFEERKSHNQAHSAFSGRVVDIGKDPVDPLFFLMHSNVDRLWARWQHTYDRFDADYSKTYPLHYKYEGKTGKEWAEANFKKLELLQGCFLVDRYDLGNFVDDELWPWGLYRIKGEINKTNENEDTMHRLSRPWRRYAESTYGSAIVPELFLKFPKSDASSFPQAPPTVRDMIDYQGREDLESTLGFDYDNIPYFDSDRPSGPLPVRITRVEHNEGFLHRSRTIEERLESAKSALIFVKEHNDAVLNIIVDKDKSEDLKIRTQAVKLVNADDENSLDTLLKVLEDITKSNSHDVDSDFAELTFELIDKIFSAKRSNRKYASRRPRFFNILRGLIYSKNTRLRMKACEILASQNDGVVLEILYNQASTALPGKLKSSEASSRLISEVDAIFLLRLNPKDQNTDLYNKIIKQSEDTEVRIAAISGLSIALEYKEDLEQIFEDGSEKDKVRLASAKSLLHLDHDRTINLVARNVAESESGDGIKLFRSATPDPDEVDFKVGLLNMLTYTGDVERLKQNEGLKSSLRELKDSGTANKASFRSSFEAFNAAPSAGPTIIEQMAAKLLNRLEGNDNE